MFIDGRNRISTLEKLFGIIHNFSEHIVCSDSYIYIHVLVCINDTLSDLPDLYWASHITKTGYFKIPSPYLSIFISTFYLIL
jgi:hypothetical protein